MQTDRHENVFVVTPSGVGRSLSENALRHHDEPIVPVASKIPLCAK